MAESLPVTEEQLDLEAWRGRDRPKGRPEQMALPHLLRGAVAKLDRALAMRTYEPADPSPCAMPLIRQVWQQTCFEALA